MARELLPGNVARLCDNRGTNKDGPGTVASGVLRGLTLGLGGL